MDRLTKGKVKSSHLKECIQRFYAVVIKHVDNYLIWF